MTTKIILTIGTLLIAMIMMPSNASAQRLLERVTNTLERVNQALEQTTEETVTVYETEVTIEAIAIEVPAQPTYEQYIGLPLTHEDPPFASFSGFTYSGGRSIRDAYGNVHMALSIYRNANNDEVYIFTSIDDDNNQTVLDILRINRADLGNNQHISFEVFANFIAPPNYNALSVPADTGNEISGYHIAIYEVSGADAFCNHSYFTNVIRAWKFNIETNRVEEVSTDGLAVFNMGFWFCDF